MAITTKISPEDTPVYYKADPFKEWDRGSLKDHEAYYRIRELYRDLPPIPLPAPKPPEPEQESGRVGETLCRIILPSGDTEVHYTADGQFTMRNATGKRLLLCVTVLENI